MGSFQEKFDVVTVARGQRNATLCVLVQGSLSSKHIFVLLSKLAQNLLNKLFPCLMF